MAGPKDEINEGFRILETFIQNGSKFSNLSREEKDSLLDSVFKNMFIILRNKKLKRELKQAKERTFF